MTQRFHRVVRRVIGVLGMVASIWLATPARSAAQEPGTIVERDARVQGHTYVFEETGVEVPYAVFLPSQYNDAREWPLIVALHGLGRPYDWMMGYESFIDFAERDGYIVVSPLGYHPRGWYGSRGYGNPAGSGRGGGQSALPDNLGELSEQDVMNVLEIARDGYNIDESRIYLWGHSMGGAGTYHLAARYPDVWAGLAVAAPAPLRDNIDQLAAFAEVPVLVLHGDEDSTVPVEGTRTWVARMRELGMQHVYIEVPGGDHSLFVRENPETLSKVFAFFNIVGKDQRSLR